MNPEQIIQTAWVNRAREDMEDLQAQGLKARQPRWPVWAPEVAVAALKAAGWTPPACACPEPSLEQRAALADKADRDAFVAALTADLAALDELDRTVEEAIAAVDESETETPI